MDNKGDKPHEADGMNGPSTSSTRGGQARLGGFGDGQGTKVGRPEAPERAQEASRGSGPSSSSVKEGLEGAILEDGDSTRDNG